MIIDNWLFTYGEYQKLVCKAPCSMYSVLLEHGLIEDPFQGLNELRSTPLSNRDCLFEAALQISEEMLEREHLELTFLGLDTICDIYLNDILLESTMNMHRTYSYDVKRRVHLGENALRLVFHSPTKYFAEMDHKHFLYTNFDSVPGAAHLRKALYMSGWDWGPKLPDMGIFRNVILEAYDGDRIDDVFVKQYHANGQVTLDISATAKHGSTNTFYAEIDGQRIVLKDGKGTVTITDPKLWWARGYGEANLYDLKVTLEKDGVIIDHSTQRIGLRTLTVSTQKDDIGNEFCFVLNGVKIFAMGANYIPQDNLLCRISPKRTKKLLESCLDANFNCIRVWGGGYYPEDDFYDFCDQNGLIVWQDFMLACINVRLTKRFREELIAEAICNVKRLRNHPSLGLLCGNNEMEAGVKSWGVGESQLVKEDYIELYERIFPEICDEYAPQTYYWPSSPSSGGGFDDPDDVLRGDSHYWWVWNEGEPFSKYRENMFRFCSEYGFESLPSMKTIRSFAEQEDLNLFSRVMELHQKRKDGNAMIIRYIADHYLYPTRFENLVYASQLLQADAIRYAVEHFRRIRGICMGSIYWQFNDCWPVSSWSSVDYFGRYKALHYAAKRFYAPVSIGLFHEKGRLTVNVSNETLGAFQGTLRVKKRRSDFTVLEDYETAVSLERLSSKDVWFISAPENELAYDAYYEVILLDAEGRSITRGTELLCKPKHFEWKKPNFRVVASETEAGVELQIASDCFAKGVCVDFEEDYILSDNYFDLTDENAYSVIVRGAGDAESLLETIKLKSVYDIDK